MAENYFGITDTGRLRDNNEDTFIAETVLNEQLIAACVIDGVGGYAGGEVAAGIAQDAILKRLGKPSVGILDIMTEAFAAANQKIQQQKQQSKENEHMACVLTMAIADVAGNKFYYAHVGDTRLYLFRDNTLVKVTHDHSFVGLLEDSGRITEEAAMNHPKRNEINRALGFDADLNSPDYIETGESPFLPGDTILLCSDGLSDMIDSSAITAILINGESLSSKAKQLIAAANDAGGKDNITVVLVHNNKSPLKHTATKPVIVAKKNEEILKEDLVKNNSRESEEPVIKDKKTRSTAVPVLGFLCICLLVALLWLLYQNYQIKERPEDAQHVVMEKKRNEQEQKLMDSINGTFSNKVLINTGEHSSIIITDSIFIQNDSLSIIGNGVTLLRDSSYAGPVFILSPGCKYILLDSLTIENFDIGILIQNRALHLKNVLFKNCRIPVQYQLLLPENKFITGGVADSLYNHSDSLPK